MEDWEHHRSMTVWQNFPTSKQFCLSKELPSLAVFAEIVITKEPSREGFVLLERCFSNMCLQDDDWIIFSFFFLCGISWTFTQTPVPKWSFAATEDQKCFLPSKNKVLKKLKIMIFLLLSLQRDKTWSWQLCINHHHPSNSPFPPHFLTLLKKGVK